MKRIVISGAVLVLLLFVGIRFVNGQEKNREVNKIVSIAITPDEDVICWDVGKFEYDVDGKPVLLSIEPQYCVDADKMTMTHKGETRGFDKATAERESAIVKTLLGYLHSYTIASTEWWRDGKGERPAVAVAKK